jgi:hypothetical protein
MPVETDEDGPHCPAETVEGLDYKERLFRARARTRHLLLSRKKHFLVLGLVSLDVAVLLANIFVDLLSCDMGERDQPWVERTQDALKTAGLVFSSIFLAELLLCLLAFGLKFVYATPIAFLKPVR